jgi:hypothetical protein
METLIPLLSDLGDMVGYYNDKNLTFSEDALAAFSGIQTHLSQTFGPMLYGLPEVFFDIALL